MACMGEKRNARDFLVGNLEGNKLHERPTRSLYGRIIIKSMCRNRLRGCGLHSLAQDRVKRSAYVNTVINLDIP